MDIFSSIKENKRKKNMSSETLLVLTPHFLKSKKNLKELKLNEIIDHQCRDLRCNGLLLPWIHVHDLKEFISNNYHILY